MAREQARRERAEAAANVATAQVASLRNEVDGLRRELDKIKRRVAGEVERAERAEQTLRDTAEQLRAVAAMRDDVLARLANRDAVHTGQGLPPSAPVVPTAPTSAGNDVAARALAQAAAATRELAEALTAAGQALAEPGGMTEQALPTASTAGHRTGHVTGVRRGGDHLLAGVRPLRPRPAVRKPIAIPGGVYGDSLAAANHLVRTPDAVILVDGYNVAKLGWPTMELLDQRELCIEMLEDLARRLGVDLRVVFDGADVVGASARRRLIRVQYSPPGVSADDVIRAEVRALPITTPVVVVTNDQAIIADVRGAGANPVSSDMLLVACGRSASR